MSNEFIIPEGLSKKERKLFKRNFFHQQQLAETKSTRLKQLALIFFVAVALLVGGFWIFRQVTKPMPGVFVSSMGNQHIESIDTAHPPYNSLPPTSGPHLGGHAQWGVSQTPIPDELQIHNLEDGGVMVQYNCSSGKESNEATPSAQGQEDCNRLIEQLSAIVKNYSDKVVLAPYPKLDTRIALTAWTRIDKFHDFDADRIERFIKAFRGIDHHT